MTTRTTMPRARPDDRPPSRPGPRIRTTVPTPGERILQQAVDARKEQARRPERTITAPASGKPPTTEHYGKTAVPPGTHAAPKDDLSPQTPSIYPSIKERPRRSFRLKEKPTAGAFTLKTRPSAEQTARSAAAPGNAPVPVGRKHTAALCVIFLVAAVIASPFSILFANEPSPGAVPLNAAAAQINMELADKLALLQSGDYDSIDIQGQGPDWREVMAVFAAKTAGADADVDVAALTSGRVDRLKAVF